MFWGTKSGLAGPDVSVTERVLYTIVMLFLPHEWGGSNYLMMAYTVTGVADEQINLCQVLLSGSIETHL